MSTMPGNATSHAVRVPAHALADLPSAETSGRQGRLRQYQMQLLERVQAARSGAVAARKELGVIVGGQHCLLDLTQLGEIVIPAGLQIQGVPLAQDWYLGLAAMRGRLTAIIDLSRYRGGAACAMQAESRIITFAPRLGLNCALLVERVLGLRQQHGMVAGATASDAAPWARPYSLRDGGQQWLRLDLALLAQQARFLDAGFGSTSLYGEHR